MRMRFAQRAARGGLTVRQIERLASRRSRGTGAPAEFQMDANIRAALLKSCSVTLGRERCSGRRPECGLASSSWNIMMTLS